MLNQFDTLQIKTVIAYPIDSTKLVKNIYNQVYLPEIPLKRIEYDSVIATLVILGILLLILIYKIIKSQPKGKGGTFLQNFLIHRKRMPHLNLGKAGRYQNLLAFLSTGGVLYYMFKYVISINLLMSITYAFGGILIFLILKRILILLVRKIIKQKFICSLHINLMGHYNKIIGLIFFIVLSILLFNPFISFLPVTEIFMFCVLIRVIVLIHKIFIILRQYRFSIFQTMLYLCILEVVPLVCITLLITKLIGVNNY